MSRLILPVAGTASGPQRGVAPPRHSCGYDSSARLALQPASGAINRQFRRDTTLVHVQHLQNGANFNPESDTSAFVDGFAPLPGEAHAVKGNYSAFSSPAFAEFAAQHAQSELVVIGYGTTMCCLATIVDGCHRGHRFALVADACAARAVRTHSEAAMHEHATAILERFARITSTAQETAP